MVVKLVRELIKLGFRSVGIISFYSSQIKLLSNEIDTDRYPEMKIDTVDSFQGQEK